MGAVEYIEQLQGRESTWPPATTNSRAADGDRLLTCMATIHIQAGRKEKIRPGDVLGALTADLGYTREQVGKIDINEFATYVAASTSTSPSEVVARLNEGRIGAAASRRGC